MKFPWVYKFNNFSICMLVFGFGIQFINHDIMGLEILGFRSIFVTFSFFYLAIFSFIFVFVFIWNFSFSFSLVN